MDDWERWQAELNQYKTLDTYAHYFSPLYNAVEPTGTVREWEQPLPLPVELVVMVYEALDLQTLVDFRCADQATMQFVDSIPKFKAILTHAPTILRAILTVECGKWISCRDLYTQLFVTTGCHKCGQFAEYLYVLTCDRVCLACFTNTKNIDYLPLSGQDAMRKCGLRRVDLAELRSMTTVSGWYSHGYYLDAVKLFDYRAARQLGISVHGTVTKMKKFCSERRAKAQKQYADRRKARKAVWGPRKDARDEGDRNPRRFVAIVRVPSLNPVA